MKVSHRDEFDTHAVIGGKEIEEFGISQTAEFFTVLSSTLYSNKPLAVIREVLCNAWDSHIVNVVKHKPVIVTITEDKLSIKDSGAGIPHELIHQIYCIYGNSTKENDGKQTGGFGLGSKSPFAYSDHFTVVNCHNGIKRVHAISRGSAMTGGKPDRRVMVEVPTTETGVEVIIPIKSFEDSVTFKDITKQVASFGEMYVLLNGMKIETVPISLAKDIIFLTTRSFSSSASRIFIRYGNVIYPIETNPEYSAEYYDLSRIITKLPNNQGNRFGESRFKAILQAPPHSISVTPSRESISLTETTIKTLKNIFREFTKALTLDEKIIKEECYKIFEEMTANSYQENILLKDEISSNELNSSYLFTTSGNLDITNIRDYTKYCIIFRKNKSFIDKFKYEYLIEKKHPQSEMLKKFCKNFFKDKITFDFGKIFYRPLYKKLAKNPILSPKNIYIVEGNNYSRSKFSWKSLHNVDESMYNSLLQNGVAITHSKLAYETDWYSPTVGLVRLRHSDARLVYIAPRGKGHYEEALAFFTKLKFFVIDYVELTKQFNEKFGVVTPITPPRKKIEGLVKLSFNLKEKVFDKTRHLIEEPERSTDYTHVVKPDALSGKYGYKKFFPWGDAYAFILASLFGHKIGICVNELQYKKQISLGKDDGFEYIMETICDAILNKPSIKNLYTQKLLNTSEKTIAYYNMLEISKYSEIIRKKFGIYNIASKNDAQYYKIFEYFCSNLKGYRETRPKFLKRYEEKFWDTHDVVKTWTTNPNYLNLHQCILKSEAINYLDLSEMSKAMRNMHQENRINYDKKVYIEASILTALNI